MINKYFQYPLYSYGTLLIEALMGILLLWSVRGQWGSFEQEVKTGSHFWIGVIKDPSIKSPAQVSGQRYYHDTYSV